MNLVPTPPYAVTDGTYWPDGKGTIPLPVLYQDNGAAYVVIDLSTVDGADSIDSINFNGIPVLATPVTFTAGDAAATAADIAAQVATDTSLVFLGDVTGNAASARLVIYRDLAVNGLKRAQPSFSYTATISNTTIFVSDARYVVEQAGAAPGDGYYIMDALDPGVRVADISTVQSLAPRQWLYLPQFHTLHKVTEMFVTGGGSLSATWGTHVFVRLDPAPGTSASAEYTAVQMPPQVGGLTVVNNGGADGVLNGQPFEAGAEFDRSILGRQLREPITYDSSGTQYAISTND